VKDFRPLRFLRGGHLQTLLGYWARRHLRWTLPTEDLVVDLDGGEPSSARGRVGATDCPGDLAPGDRVRVRFTMGVMVSVEREDG